MQVDETARTQSNQESDYPRMSRKLPTFGKQSKESIHAEMVDMDK